MKLLYLKRHLICVLIFLGTFLFLTSLFPARCKDGWNSNSIGKMGACSHHGGVSKSPLPFFISLFLTLGFLGITEKRYEERYRRIVLRSLPPHPLENNEPPAFKEIYCLPDQKAKSRKYWRCNFCCAHHEPGSVYYYFGDRNGRFPRRVKFCNDCALKLPEVNNENRIFNATLREEIAATRREVTKYYEKHRIDKKAS